MKKPKAIRSLECIRQRCWINDEGHWIWKGAINGKGTPIAKIPGLGICTVRRLAYAYKHGLKYTEIPFQRMWTDQGGSLNVNPAHAIGGTIADFNKFHGPGRRGMTARLVAVKGRSTRGRRYTPEQIAYIKTCGKTERELSEELGCSRALIGYIRRGKCYVSMTRGASVFSMGLAA